MPNRAESNRVLDREGQNLIWISGEFPTTSFTQHEEPFVVGSRSLLEVIHSDYDLRTVGIFYAPFSIFVEEVGFNDTSRFYHQFRKLTGSSPAKCRR